MFICRFRYKNVQIHSIDNISIDEIMIIAPKQVDIFYDML